MVRFWDRKTTVEECRVLSIFAIKQEGVLHQYAGSTFHVKWTGFSGNENSIGGRALPDRSAIELSYVIESGSSPDGPDKMQYQVDLTPTSCYFGGERFWFRCPLVVNGIPCKRRVGKLYLPPGAKYFGCRHCYDLSYRSKQVSRQPLIRPLERYMSKPGKKRR